MFEREVKPRLRGAAFLVRYCDDFVIAFERRDDAERVLGVLGQRMEKYGLGLHPEKTRLVPFARPMPGHKGKGAATFDFLGFTSYWRRTRRGGRSVWCKTRSARLTRAIRAVYDLCRRQRHRSVKEQHAALCKRLQGHFNYFGVNGNSRSLHALREQVRRIWYKWLRRRSQRTRLTWERYEDLLRGFPFPRVRVMVSIWTASP